MPGLFEKDSRRHARPKSKDYIALKAEVQNSTSSRVYIFGDNDIQEEDVVEFELSEVRSRRAPPKEMELPGSREPIYFERQISEGDTLQSISLQYGCRVAELKRMNRLMKDQEFFGLRVIKVPLKKHSFLTEFVSQSDSCPTSSTITDPSVMLNGCMGDGATNDRLYLDSACDSPCDFSDHETQQRVIRTLSINDVFHGQSKEAKTFLENMDKDLSEIRSSATFNRNSLDEVISVLTNKSIQPIKKKSYFLSGADCGIRWTVLVVIALIIVLLPVIYFIYYEVNK
ncbi:hypothetical protein ScPMuIL_018490 [Solemya velum]